MEGVSTHPPESNDPGEPIFGRYHICEQLAAGGMASVFLAKADGPGGFEKFVAIKRIHSNLAHEKTIIDMFLDEARIAAQINHPNVCTVFDFGQTGDTYFIAMDYIVGETLLRFHNKDQDHLRWPGWPIYAARIIAEAAEGLHAAHELVDETGQLRNVVHRDVSPHNIFVRYDGAVSVVDFGIARAEGQLHHTRTGGTRGKLAYMSPEQMSDDDPVDRRADIWGLGVCLWELVTGSHLFRRANEAKTIRAVTSSKIPRPSSLRPKLPLRLDDIIMRALSRDVDDRYQTAREMAQDLNQCVADRGEALGMAEISEMMRSVFSADFEKKRALLERARAAKPRPLSSFHSFDGPAPDAMGTTPSTFQIRPRMSATKLAIVGGFALVLVLGGFLAVNVMMQSSEGASPPSSDTASAAGNVPVANTESESGAEPQDEAPPPEPASAVVVAPKDSKRDRRRNRRKAARAKTAKTKTAPEKKTEEKSKAPSRPAESPEETKPVAAPAPKQPLAAKASATGVSVQGSLQASVVRRAISRVRSAFQACYKPAATRAKRNGFGSVKVSLVIDSSRRARQIKVGKGPLPGISGCIKTAAAKIRTRIAPDVGTARVSFSVKFRARR